MYPRTKLLISTVIALTIFSCSSLNRTSKEETVNVVKNSDIVQNTYRNEEIEHQSFYVDNAQFRLDYNGQLRSLKAIYGFKVDSFLYVNLRTPFGKSVASFIANKNSIIFEDYQVQRVYLLDYNTLSQLTKIPINFNLLQNLFVASYTLQKHNVDFINSDSLANDFSIYKNLTHLNDTAAISEILRFNINPLFIKQWEIHSQKEESTFNAEYEWKDSFSKVHPKYVDISFNYGDSPVEIEFDFKTIYHDSLISYKLDTTLMPEIILFNE